MTPDLSIFDRGGAVIWIIAGLSVVALAIIAWKVLHLLRLGAWGGSAAEAAVTLFETQESNPGAGKGGLRLRTVRAAISAVTDPRFSDAAAREETERQARRLLVEARTGLRALEVIATIAPLLGLLGTVLGMIAAFQALQAAGSQADPALLAGGIWEALLTTAAGMAVAIPASASLTWFEAVIERMRRDVEDNATRIFIAARPDKISIAAA